jgi:hypothetical protein
MDFSQMVSVLLFGWERGRNVAVVYPTETRAGNFVDGKTVDEPPSGDMGEHATSYLFKDFRDSVMIRHCCNFYDRVAEDIRTMDCAIFDFTLKIP